MTVLHMQPNLNKITISNNEEQIILMLKDLMFLPRLKALEWSNKTKQTPNLKIGYPGQHLASLITGVQGERTGARGNDLADGSEVKSCSRVDQLDTCKDCKNKVLRIEQKCAYCGSFNIDRKKDSKWLFAIRTENELNLITQKIDRVVLILADYPGFDESYFEDIRIQAFELWPKHPRNINFAHLLEHYYKNIYLTHIAKNPNATPAPMNFWPDLFQFYICNPIQVFDCIVKNANISPEFEIKKYIQPAVDRINFPSVNMPAKILNADEFRTFANASKETILENLRPEKTYEDFLAVQKIESDTTYKKEMLKLFAYINENLRYHIPLRDMREAKELALYTRQL